MVRESILRRGYNRHYLSCLGVPNTLLCIQHGSFIPRYWLLLLWHALRSISPYGTVCCLQTFVCLLMLGLAQVCVVTACMTITRARIEVNIPRKRRGSCTNHEKVRKQTSSWAVLLPCGIISHNALGPSVKILSTHYRDFQVG